MAKPFVPKQAQSITEDVGTVSGNFLTLATDADGDTLTVARVDGQYVDDTHKKGANTFAGTYGTLTIHEDGTYTYTLDPSINLPNGTVVTEDFSIKIRDGSGLFSQNVLSISITGTANHKPTAVDDHFTMSGTTFVGNVLANDFDTDGDALHASAIGLGKQTGTHLGTADTVINGVYGTLTINSSGNFTYHLDTSDADYILLGGAGGVEHFSYKVGDGQPEKPNMDFGYLDIAFS